MAVAELAFRDGIMDQIRLREQRFDERAYLFLLAALEHCQTRLTERRHITGPELAHSCRELALQRFGVTARLVLEHWGVTSTSDIGDIIQEIERKVIIHGRIQKGWILIPKCRIIIHYGNESASHGSDAC